MKRITPCQACYCVLVLIPNEAACCDYIVSTQLHHQHPVPRAIIIQPLTPLLTLLRHSVHAVSEPLSPQSALEWVTANVTANSTCCCHHGGRHHGTPIC